MRGKSRHVVPLQESRRVLQGQFCGSVDTLNPAKDLNVRPCVCVCPSVLVANGSLNLAARAIVLRAFYFIWRYRTLLRRFTVQGRCIGPETRALLAAILRVFCCHSLVSTGLNAS